MMNYQKYIVVVGALIVVALSYGLYTYARSDEHTVSWEEAVRRLHRGEVVSFYERHNRNVELTLEDGTTIGTEEPSVGEIMRQLKDCGERCQNFVYSRIEMFARDCS